MNREAEILKYADYYKKIECGDASAYFIINKKMSDYNCMFGFTDFPNDIYKTKELFSKLEAEARSFGYNYIAGPINYCTWMSYRWAISNFGLKLYPDCGNPAYYPDIIRALGYRELYTYRSALINIDNPLFLKGEDIYKDKLSEGFEFKFFQNDEVYNLAKAVYDISADAFTGSYLYSEIPFEAFKEIYLSWTKGLKSGLFVAYDKDEPVGYVFGYDNPYGDNFISKTSAVKKEYQNKKIYVALHYLGCKYVSDKGYSDIVYHFQCEQRDTFKRFGGDIEKNEKRYAVFIKDF